MTIDAASLEWPAQAAGLDPPVAAALRVVLGPAGLLLGGDIGQHYLSDKSQSGSVRPLAVLRPRTTLEVSRALRICHGAGLPVVPQGGMTGLAGGGNPAGNDIVMTLELMRGIEEIDAAAATMTVLAGTPLEEAQAAAAGVGLFLALDLGSRGSCQIGGNISTNAGGIRVIRYGMARDQVLGLEAVLADGTVLSSLNKMMKNNAGYDIKQLFIGSEGTLGVITRAVLRLHPPPGAIATALCALPSYDHVVRFLRHAIAGLTSVVAFEAMWRDYFVFTSTALGHRFFDGGHRFWVILEATASADSFEACLAEALEAGLIGDALVAKSNREARDFWAVRDGLAIDALPNLVNFDVSLPIARIGEFAERCTLALRARWPKSHVFHYGHIGDSNLHVSVSAGFDQGEGVHDVDETVYDLVRGYGGSISAEHGIGTLKRRYLGHSRSAAELAVMRALKHALDPKGILNPGKVI